MRRLGKKPSRHSPSFLRLAHPSEEPDSLTQSSRPAGQILMALPEASAATPLPQVRLKIARRSAHPWIFQKMVEKPAARLPAGSVVDVLDRDGQWVGRGFYNGHSRIALRVLTADPDEAIDTAFFARRLGR